MKSNRLICCRCSSNFCGLDLETILVQQEQGRRGEKSLMKSVNLQLSERKSQTNYGPGSSSLDHRERWPCMVHFDQLTHNTAPHFITLISLSVSGSLVLAHPQLQIEGQVVCSLRVQTGQSGHHVNFSQDAGVFALTRQRGKGEGRCEILQEATGRFRVSLVFSVRLTEVQVLAGSKPYSESTVKLHGWFDCSSPLC